MATLKATNPFTLEAVGEYEYEDCGQVSGKIARANKAFDAWKRTPVAERVGLVRAALDYFEKNKSKVAEGITRQMGKPIVQAENEVGGLVERANHMCDIAGEVLATDALAEKENFERGIAHCPLGVILIIAPWNYPLLTAINGVATALVAGNTVILKHSSLTPAVGEHFQKAFGVMGEHKDVLQHVVVDHATAAKVIEEADIHHVVFTGSVRGGHEIQKSLSRRFLDANLELGGKDGAYVASDADVRFAAENLVDGAMYNAGQSCCGIERVYVNEAVYDEFVDIAKKTVDAYVLGDPFDRATTMGPLSSAKAARIMEEQVADAVKKGATVLSGGEVTLIGKGTFFEPTLLVDVNHDMEVMREENFGPVMPVMKVKSDEEAIDLVNDSEYGLTASIWTSDRERAHRFGAEVDAGTIYMNRCDYLDPALPWTGVKDSGKGSALSRYGFYALTRCKSLHFRTGH
ncbi:MAG: aldehyde dehydrogenase family protein [Planctomycetota bacterium]|jgi:acyl-CoA reductase-like NAD-dependent aldehyde dehydrogenase